MHDEERTRREARRHWPVTVHALGAEPPLDPTTPLQRVGMMWELVVQAWAIAGHPIPDYDRAHTPIRILRRHEVEEP